VEIMPDGFDANVALGDAAAAAGDKLAAKAAYEVAMRGVAKMEPTAQAHWRPILEGKLAKAGSDRHE
jgi:hypothetical protein